MFKNFLPKNLKKTSFTVIWVWVSRWAPNASKLVKNAWFYLTNRCKKTRGNLMKPEKIQWGKWCGILSIILLMVSSVFLPFTFTSRLRSSH